MTWGLASRQDRGDTGCDLGVPVREPPIVTWVVDVDAEGRVSLGFVGQPEVQLVPLAVHGEGDGLRPPCADARLQLTCSRVCDGS